MKHRRSCPKIQPGSAAFAGYRFPPEVILLADRWYLRFGLSYRDLEELIAERGVEVDHVTLFRWVHRFTPLLVEAARPCRHAVGDRWFVDETYVKVAGVWRYVYRAVGQNGQVIDVYVPKKRDTTTAKKFFNSAIIAHGEPVEATTDKSPVLTKTIRKLVAGAHHDTTQYANNRVENDHGRLKVRLRPMRGLQTDRTASVIIRGHAFMRTCDAGTTNSASMPSPDSPSQQRSMSSQAQSEIRPRPLRAARPSGCRQRNGAEILSLTSLARGRTGCLV